MSEGDTVDIKFKIEPTTDSFSSPSLQLRYTCLGKTLPFPKEKKNKWSHTSQIVLKENIIFPVVLKLEMFAKTKIPSEEPLGSKEMIFNEYQMDIEDDWVIPIASEIIPKLKTPSRSNSNGHSLSPRHSLSEDDPNYSPTQNYVKLTIHCSFFCQDKMKITPGKRFLSLKLFGNKQKNEVTIVRKKKSKVPSLNNSSQNYNLKKIMETRNLMGLKQFLKTASKEEANSAIDDQGNTLLHTACVDCQILSREFLFTLLNCPLIDVNVCNKSNNTPLHYLSCYWQDTDTTVFDNFITLGADVNALNATKESPLLKAILNRSVRSLILKTLLKRGADPTLVNSHGEGVLHYAARQGRVDLVLLLLGYCQDITRVGREGMTPAQIAINEEKLHQDQMAQEYRQVSELFIKVEELDQFLREYQLIDHRQYFIENELFLDIISVFTEADIEKIDLKMGPKNKLIRGISEYQKKMKSDKLIKFESQIREIQNRQQGPNDEYIEEVRQSLINMAISVGHDVVFIDYSQLEFVYQLGVGSSGIVWKGKLRHEERGENSIEVAIKTLNNNNADDEEFWVEFVNEFKVLHSIKHQNVVKLFGVCLEPSVNLVMEYCARGSLFHVLSNSKFKMTWERFFSFCKETVEGLHVLHTYTPKILHRDLKTLNLLITQDYKVKVADFGLSLDSNALSVDLKAAKGTGAYMPPELFSGNSRYTTKSDIYSLGIIFWELLNRIVTGKYSTPYNNLNVSPLIIITLVSQGKRPDLPENAPACLCQLVTQCYTGEPELRPECPEIMYTLLNAETEYKANSELWGKILEKEVKEEKN